MPIALTFLKSRLGIGLFAALALGMLWLRGSHYRDQRDELREWQGEVISATREAAHHPRLARDQVALQIRNMGLSLDRIVEAQEAARALAEAAKQERERRDRDNKRKHDDALPGQLADARRRADAYFDRHRMHLDQGPASVAGSAERPDLPSPAFGAEEPDRSGGPADLVAITRADADRCTVNSVRLMDAQEWAVEAGLAVGSSGR